MFISIHITCAYMCSYPLYLKQRKQVSGHMCVCIFKWFAFPIWIGYMMVLRGRLEMKCRAEKYISREGVCWKWGKITLRTDLSRAVSGQTSTQWQGAFIFIALKGVPKSCLLECFERKDFMVFIIHTFVYKTQLSLHIPDSMCFYMSMLIVMLFLFFFLNDTFCIIIHSPTGERKKEYFIQHCVGKNAFQDALCVFFNFIYSSDCRGS